MPLLYHFNILVKNKKKTMSIWKMYVPVSCSSYTKFHTSIKCEHEARAKIFFNFQNSQF